MIQSFTQPTHRAISVIALFQAGVVVVGTAFVMIMLKMKGYGMGVYPIDWYPRLPVFIHDFGFYFILLPAAWAGAAIIWERMERSLKHPSILMLAGALMIAAGIWFYIETGLNTEPRPVPLMQMP